MAFFDLVGKKLLQTGQDTVQKTKNLAESVKLGGIVAEEEKKINRLLLSMGKAYFDANQQNPDSPMRACIDEIIEAQGKIAEHEGHIKALRSSAKCPSCGGDMPTNAAFCNHCGYNPAMQQTTFVGSRCKQCAAPLPEGQLFCTNCGTRQEVPEGEDGG